MFKNPNGRFKCCRESQVSKQSPGLPVELRRLPRSPGIWAVFDPRWDAVLSKETGYFKAGHICNIHSSKHAYHMPYVILHQMHLGPNQ